MMTTDHTPSGHPPPTHGPPGETGSGHARAGGFGDAALLAGGYTSVLFAGAIFGFFYAWVCSTMWGLDDADPRVAIEAMRAMNASVRNAAFFPAFFLTPVVLGLTAIAARRAGHDRAATRFGLGALVYLLGGAVLTMALNVPMNEDLAEVVVPATIDEAEAIWSDYSGRWQLYNLTRTVFSGIALLLAAGGLRQLRPTQSQASARVS